MGLSTILVVDDNYGIRRLMYEFLTQEGYLVKLASDGQMALQMIKEEKPRLILLDLRMPGLGGMQTLTKLRELDLCGDTAVVMMSAYFDAKDLKKSVQEGLIKYFIIKPFDLLEIRVLIHDLMRGDIDQRENIIS
ncbi:response regulator with CheY-like receiver, AAA-type ATPase, and DNA-binding domains [Desulfosporosinus orientis DSM 765]|uniref:Stage 0 sporulation protein A homolog n=1 Tax=Desulfosporosinus orientis (strain ATCC 19365 / DSM 765 / NCIMB 8382 / VKM B-1628 / Singapore I) TaxID=768706 RepID=G7W5S0_DESOD|nr:response regulator [Desulfosporosinus orientis]AET67008.1 response regulator with CheY-like receiver, AAA-type ATPase, and DNA-binding domains [Desulfosporosinus orientis DSM 765]